MGKNRLKSVGVITALAITAGINLVGCGQQEEAIYKQEIVTDITDDEVNQNDEMLVEEDVLEVSSTKELEKNNVDLTEFFAKIDAIEVNYNYPEYYFNDKCYEKLLECLGSKKECKNTTNYFLFDVYEAIINNSNNFADQSQIAADLQTALIQALSNIFNSDSYVGDDFCKLKDITIKTGKLNDGIAGQYINDQNLIIINNDIKKAYEEYKELMDKEDLTFVEYLTKILQHELNHARQSICSCRENEGQINSSIHYIDNVNGIFGALIEASAESQIYNFDVNKLKTCDNKTGDFTYLFERESQSLLLLMGMFKEGFTLDKYYQAIYDSDLQAFYDLYQLETKEDFVAFYNVAYAIDSLNSRTMLSFNLYDNGYDTVGEINEQIGYGYRVEIFKTASKDLIKRISAGELTFEESLKLYNFAKDKILNGAGDMEKLNDEWVYLYDEKLINGIGVIDDVFYQFICQYFDVSKYAIDELMSDFGFGMELLYLCNCSDSDTEYSSEVQVANSELIEKFPLITEISFCSPTFNNIDEFENARAKGLTKEKY